MAPGRAEDRSRGGAPAARRDRQRHHVPRQRLGLQRRPERGAHGQGHRRSPRRGLPHDQGLHARTRRQGGDAAARRLVAAPAHRPPRSLADSRGGLRRRAGPALRARRRRRGAGPRAPAGQGPLRRLHRPQIAIAPPGDAGARLCMGFVSAALELLRRVVPELRAGGVARAEPTRHRTDWHEEPERRRATRDGEGRLRGRGARLRPQPPGRDGRQRDRHAGSARAESLGGAGLPPDVRPRAAGAATTRRRARRGRALRAVQDLRGVRRRRNQARARAAAAAGSAGMDNARDVSPANEVSNCGKLCASAGAFDSTSEGY